MRSLFFGILLLTSVAAGAVNEEVLTKVWPAKWIDVPGISGQEYGVYHFRRAFDIPHAPGHLVVYISGDNRYELFVNGTRAVWGPARGDLTHWRYETVDVGPYLHSGKNLLAAVVWNDGPYRAVAQISNRTGFLLQSADAAYNLLNTSAAWKCAVDKAYSAPAAPARSADRLLRARRKRACRWRALSVGLGAGFV